MIGHQLLDPLLSGIIMSAVSWLGGIVLGATRRDARPAHFMGIMWRLLTPPAENRRVGSPKMLEGVRVRGNHGMVGTRA